MTTQALNFDLSNIEDVVQCLHPADAKWIREALQKQQARLNFEGHLQREEALALEKVFHAHPDLAAWKTRVQDSDTLPPALRKSMVKALLALEGLPDAK